MLGPKLKAQKFFLFGARGRGGLDDEGRNFRGFSQHGDMAGRNGDGGGFHSGGLGFLELWRNSAIVGGDDEPGGPGFPSRSGDIALQRGNVGRALGGEEQLLLSRG